MAIKENNQKMITLDATDQSLGRLASRIAIFLQDKHRKEYAPNKEGETIVIVNNLGKIKFTGSKMKTKIYYRHTGYIGHLKEERLEEKWKKKPEEVLKLAIKRMLPNNKLRKRRLKRLKINI